jgi:hypothetical protein
MNNEEASHRINFLWFDLGPFAFFPCLLLSVFLRRIGGTLLVCCGLAFILLSLIARPFSLPASGLLIQVFEIGLPMVFMGLVRLKYRHDWLGRISGNRNRQATTS